MTTTSASAASSVASKPACSSNPAIRSESWTFIWQPKVSITYLRATSTFRFRPFAFRLRLSSHQHLTRRPPKAIADRFTAEHPRELVDAPVLAQAVDRRPRPPALDALVDFKMRV